MWTSAPRNDQRRGVAEEEATLSTVKIAGVNRSVSKNIHHKADPSAEGDTLSPLRPSHLGKVRVESLDLSSGLFRNRKLECFLHCHVQRPDGKAESHFSAVGANHRIVGAIARVLVEISEPTRDATPIERQCPDLDIAHWNRSVGARADRKRIGILKARHGIPRDLT